MGGSQNVLPTALASAAISTVVLFLFNVFPLGAKVVERHMGAKEGSALWWTISCVYYFVLFFVIAVPIQWASSHWLCEVSPSHAAVAAK